MRTKDTKKVIKLMALLLICCSACKRSLKSDAYIRYVRNEDNGLLKTVKLPDWEFDLQYKPYDYIMYLENRGNKDFDRKKRLKTLKGTAWFNISFKRAQAEKSPMRYNITTLDEYNKRLSYYINEASHDIELIYDKDTLKPMSYLFETNYNLTPEETIIVGFDLPDKNNGPHKDMQLVYYDRVFGNGIIKSLYSSKALNNIPNLIF